VSRDEPLVPLNVKGVPPEGMSRRQAMQWVMAAVAASSMSSSLPTAAQEVGRTVTPQEKAAEQPKPTTTKGYGTDPDLMAEYKPGAFWRLTFNADQKKTAAVLADLIIPRDRLGPAASEVGVVEMLDEWISAPYPEQQADRPIVLEGLAWLDTESGRRFGKAFTKLSDEQKKNICDDICFTETAAQRFKKAAEFFSRFRSICASAYYATPAGWEAIGYVGNVALGSFEGPPAEVLKRLGVTQTVA
jgi:Gluconate 2-dehydrogenase subunit 3